MSTNNSSASFPIRIARRCWRIVWNRRTAWMLVCLISLTVLYYQWENWRSARELVETRKRLIARLCVDNLLDLAPPKIADDQNWFVNPVVESWLVLNRPNEVRFQYKIPKDVLVPQGFVMPEVIEGKDGNADVLDLTAWSRKRGNSLVPAPEMQLASELGDGNGLLPKLAQGLSKPYSLMKPYRRDAIEKSGGNPWEIVIPSINSNDFQRQLCLHLRSAALVGDKTKARETALIALRFSEASSQQALVGCLVSLALHGIAFDAMHDAMNRSAWTEDALVQIQRRLAVFDDLKNVEDAFSNEALGLYQTAAWLHGNRIQWAEMFVLGQVGEKSLGQRLEDWLFHAVAAYGPIGWHDANIAYWTDRELDLIGPKAPDAWLNADQRSQKVAEECKNIGINPRRLLGAIAIPNVGNIFRAGAENLFRRRCLIIACTLQRYRLKNGAFPESLEAVQAELAPYKPMDPALPDKLLRYRVEKDGYLLWSAGPDAQDNGGDAEKDWLWRIRRP